MIVVCKPEESKIWYDKLWQNTVDLFRSLDIPVRTLECCSGDLADLKVKSCDVEAWSPRQKKYFEVGSCSNLGDAQARRLGIRVKGEDGTKYFAHTLNNTVVAPPRMLIAFLENNLQEDGSVKIPKHYSHTWAEQRSLYLKIGSYKDKRMHQYLKSIGFGNIRDKKQLIQIIRDVEESYTGHQLVTQDEVTDLCEFDKEYGEGIGIKVCGDMDIDEQFDYRYYAPYSQDPA